jgi:hypothetical protein
MATVGEVLARYRALDVRRAAFEAAAAHPEELVDIQKDQLWAGQDLSGGDLSPTILDDPYFVEKARRMNARNVSATARRLARAWSDYKDRQHQWAGNPEIGERKRGRANLIFTSGAVVWNPLRVTASGEALRLATEPNVQADVERKYGPVFGLNPAGARYFIRTVFRRDFMANVRGQLRG